MKEKTGIEQQFMKKYNIKIIKTSIGEETNTGKKQQQQHKKH